MEEIDASAKKIPSPIVAGQQRNPPKFERAIVSTNRRILQNLFFFIFCL